MASRGRTTFQKAQKERARKEKQERKAERREQRKMTRGIEETTPSQDPAEISAENGEPDDTQPEGDHWRSPRGQEQP